MTDFNSEASCIFCTCALPLQARPPPATQLSQDTLFFGNVSLLSGWGQGQLEARNRVHAWWPTGYFRLGDLQARALLEPGKRTRLRAAAYYSVATQTKPLLRNVWIG